MVRACSYHKSAAIFPVLSMPNPDKLEVEAEVGTGCGLGIGTKRKETSFPGGNEKPSR